MSARDTLHDIEHPPPGPAEKHDEWRATANAIDRHDAELEEIRVVVRNHIDEERDSRLTDDERAWVKLAMQAQAQRVQLRQAIIEKSLTGLVWGAVVWLGTVLAEYIRAHGWKS